MIPADVDAEAVLVQHAYPPVQAFLHGSASNVRVDFRAPILDVDLHAERVADPDKQSRVRVLTRCSSDHLADNAVSRATYTCAAGSISDIQLKKYSSSKSRLVRSASDTRTSADAPSAQRESC